jgi:hypothetical protein
VHTATALETIDPRAPPLLAIATAPANASENPLHLENEALTMKEHEDRCQEEEIPRGGCWRY